MRSTTTAALSADGRAAHRLRGEIVQSGSAGWGMEVGTAAGNRGGSRAWPTEWASFEAEAQGGGTTNAIAGRVKSGRG